MNIAKTGLQSEMNTEKEALNGKQEYSSPALKVHGRVGSKTQGSGGTFSDGSGHQLVNPHPGGGGSGGGGGTH
jgi:hypothetical protein